MTRVRQSGFTLVEAVVVMVVTSILAGIMVLFIRQPVQNYVDAVGRAELSDVADLALRRIAREVRGALPNSIRVTAINGVLLLEFIPTKAGGTYLSVQDNQSSGNPLDFVNHGLSFDVVGPMPVAPYAIMAGDSIVIYNLGTDFQDADAYQGNNRAQVAQVSGNTVTLLSNTFSSRNMSPTQRFAVVTRPVTYAWDPTARTLTRYWNYGYNLAQAMPSGGSSALMAANVTACVFDYTQLANVQNGLLGLSLTLARADNNAERATLVHQIHVDNTP
ncbi:prepilin-type N-terminal cleavage/methylation domain-containing protein [Oxalobacteraceae bacterium A2-2]